MSRPGKKELKSSRDIKASYEPLCGVGEKSLLCDPGSELRLGGREKKEGEDNKWDGKNKIKCSVDLPTRNKIQNTSYYGSSYTYTKLRNKKLRLTSLNIFSSSESCSAAGATPKNYLLIVRVYNTRYVIMQ